MVEETVMPPFAVGSLYQSFDTAWLQPLIEPIEPPLLNSSSGGGSGSGRGSGSGSGGSSGSSGAGHHVAYDDSSLDLDVGTPACNALRARYAAATATAATAPPPAAAVPVTQEGHRDRHLAGCSVLDAAAAAVEDSLRGWRLAMAARHVDPAWDAVLMQRSAAALQASGALAALAAPDTGSTATTATSSGSSGGGKPARGVRAVTHRQQGSRALPDGTLLIPRNRDVVRASNAAAAAIATAAADTGASATAGTAAAATVAPASQRSSSRRKQPQPQQQPQQQQVPSGPSAAEAIAPAPAAAPAPQPPAPDWLPFTPGLPLNPVSLSDPSLQTALSGVRPVEQLAVSLQAGFACAPYIAARLQLAGAGEHHSSAGSTSAPLQPARAAAATTDDERLDGDDDGDDGEEEEGGRGGHGGHGGQGPEGPGDLTAAAVPAASPSAVSAAETVLHVCVYPHSSSSSRHAHRQRQEFLVLGSNSLAQLRDRIYCLRDALVAEAAVDSAAVRGGRSSHAPVAAAAGAGVDPSIFCMEGVCYDDTRPTSGTASSTTKPLCSCAVSTAAAATSAPAPVRLSAGPVAWSAAALSAGVSTGWPPLQYGCMQHTTFNQLAIRLGAHYLYRHRGDCEHLLVFTDARLLSASPGAAATVAAHDSPAAPAAAAACCDVLRTSAYPRRVSPAAAMRRRPALCDACSVHVATSMSVGHPATDSSPAYLCHACWQALSCDATGAMLYPTVVTLPYLQHP